MMAADGSTLYYVDKTRQAMVSGFCVVGHCPEPIQTSGKRRGEKQLKCIL